MLVDDGRLIFYGHEAFPGGLFANVLLAFLSLAFLKLFLGSYRKRSKVGMLTWGYFYFWYMPNAAYLFIEIKHLVMRDAIADNFELGAVLGFGLLSMLGLVVSVLQIYTMVKEFPLLKKRPIFSVIGLSMLSAWGATMGLLNINSAEGMMAPLVVFVRSLAILLNPDLTKFFVLTSLVLATSTLISFKSLGLARANTAQERLS